MKQNEFYDYISDHGPLGFLDIKAGQIVSDLIEKNPGIKSFLTDDLTAGMRRSYKERMVPVYLRTVGEQLLQNMRRLDPFGAIDPTKAENEVVYRAMEEVKETFAYGYFEKNLPLSVPFYEVMTGNFRDSQDDFIKDFLANKQKIEKQLLGGKKIDRIMGYIGGGGDSHRHGRSVFGIKTDAGSFFYKPHDCKLDKLYHTLISELFNDCTVAADCVTGDGCGFVSELRIKETEQQGDIRTYYHNFGILTALFYGIGAVDMHFDNIIPAGVRPCAIDLETMFKPELRSFSKKGVTRKTADSRTNSFAYTVLRTMVLPRYTRKTGIISPFYHSFTGSGHLPRYAGNDYTVEGYEEDFITGFEEGYIRVQTNRKRIEEMFLSFEDAELRYLLRNTEYYNLMRQMLWRPKALSDKAEQRRILDRLRTPFTHNNYDVDEGIVKYEEECLLEGDIPYYSTTLDGYDLCGSSPDQKISCGAFKESARRAAFKTLEIFGEEDKRFETDTIRNSLRCSAVPVSMQEEAWEIEKCDSREVLDDKISKLLQDINDNIRESGIHSTGDRILFLTQTPDLADKKYSGMACCISDILRYFGTINRQGFDYPADIAEMSLRLISEKIEEWLQEDELYIRATISQDIYGGIGAVILGIDEMCSAGNERAENIYDGLINLISDKKMYMIDSKKSISKLAGLITALSLSRKGHSKKKGLIKDASQVLISFLPDNDLDVLYLAYVGAAMSLSFRETGNGKCEELAGWAYEQLCRLYNEKLCGWTGEVGKFKWLPVRSEYSPWIGLCACIGICSLRSVEGKLTALMETDSEIKPVSGEAKGLAEKVAELAAKSVMKENTLRYRDSLYHGNALSVYFLNMAGDLLGQPEITARGEDILHTMFLRYEKLKVFHTSPEGIRDFFDVSYSFGVPGIGAAALAIKKTKEELT